MSLTNNTTKLNEILDTVNSLPSTVSIDSTLTVAGKAADAKAVGDAINEHVSNKSNPHGVTASQIGAADSSHNHSASDITSGTLSVARGGTGNTSVDTTPTSGSTKMVTSGGIYTALQNNNNTFVAIYNQTTYEEVASAYYAKKLVVCNYYGIYANIHGLSSSGEGAMFYASTGTGITYITLSPSNVWNANALKYNLFAIGGETEVQKTFGSAVIAQRNSQTESSYLLRNSMLASSSATPSYNGEITWVYE